MFCITPSSKLKKKDRWKDLPFEEDVVELNTDWGCWRQFICQSDSYQDLLTTFGFTVQHSFLNIMNIEINHKISQNLLVGTHNGD